MGFYQRFSVFEAIYNDRTGIRWIKCPIRFKEQFLYAVISAVKRKFCAGDVKWKIIDGVWLKDTERVDFASV